MKPLLISPQEAERVLGLSKNTVQRMMQDGTLRWVKVRRSVRIRYEDVERVALKGCAA